MAFIMDHNEINAQAQVAIAQLFLDGPCQYHEAWNKGGIRELLHLELAFCVNEWYSLMPMGLELAILAPTGLWATICSAAIAQGLNRRSSRG